MVTAREPVTEPPHATQREAPNPGPNIIRAAPAAPGSPVSSSHAPPPARPVQDVATTAKPAPEPNHGKPVSKPSYADTVKSGVVETVQGGVGLIYSVTNAFRGSARPNSSKQNSRDTGSHKRKDDDSVQSSRDYRRRREDDPAQNSRDHNRRREEDTRRHQRDSHKKREPDSEGVLLDTAELELDESPQERDPPASKTHEHRGQTLREREQEQREKNKVLSAKLQHLEAQNDQLQGHIQKMSHIIQQLQRQGLPLPPDDGHFSREFDQLTGDVRQWARLASKGQPPMTEVIWMNLGPEMHEIISPAFADLQELLATNPPRSLRTRFMELTIFRSFHECIFGRRVLGVSTGDYSHLEALWNSMFVGKSTSERDLHCWNALSIHLLTRDNDSFETKRETKIDKAAKKLAEQLKPLGAPGQATFPELRQMLYRAAQLGLQIAQLPFSLATLYLQPGMPFQHKILEDIDNEGDGEELEISSVPVRLVLFPTVVRMDFDCSGNRVDNASYTADMVVISKGRVVCQL